MPLPFRAVLLASAISLTLAACNKPAAPPQMPPPQVTVMEAKPQTVPLQRELVGRLAPFRSADVRARIPGVLQKRIYQEGEDVKEGQLLFRIDPSQLQAALNASQGGLASARASYSNAHTTAQRARQLISQKFVSQADLDNAEAAERSSAAAVQQAQADVENARINLGFASVTAPISGRAGKQQVTEGALVGQGTPTLLTTVEQIDPLYVNFSLSNNELDQLRRAQTAGSVELVGAGKANVQVQLSDGTPYSHTGILDFSDITVDPTTGAVSLRAVLPNPDKQLFPGSFVSLNTTFGEQRNAYLIPQSAILRDAAGPYAMVLGADGNVIRKTVVTNGVRGTNWLITEGLSPGDQVITANLQKVREGAPATIAPATPPAAAGAAPAPAAKSQ